MAKPERPDVILECGAGVSTLVSTAYLASRDERPPRRGKVIALEQGLETKRAVEKRLAKAGFGDLGHVLHAPFDARVSYRYAPDDVRALMGQGEVDWVLVDGPAGPEGCRWATLPGLARFCRPGARWFLDDALRDGELVILRQWSRLPGIVVEGIHPVGKGLATGVINDPEKVTL